MYIVVIKTTLPIYDPPYTVQGNRMQLVCGYFMKRLDNEVNCNNRILTVTVTVRTFKKFQMANNFFFIEKRPLQGKIINRVEN